MINIQLHDCLQLLKQLYVYIYIYNYVCFFVHAL